MLPCSLPLLLALPLLSASLVAASPYSFLDNYHDPAPPPQDGPPASRHASRNPNLIPAQVCAIAAGYVLAVLFWAILLLTAGRRMRTRTQNSPKTLELELVTRKTSAHIQVQPMSPASTKSATSWFRKGFKPRNPDGLATSPVVQSPASFDQNVLNAHRERAMDEMDRLYAAVMVHDRKRSLSHVSTSEIDSVAAPPLRPQAARRPSAIDTGRIERFQHSNPASPVQAIYPPGYQGPPTGPLPRPMQREPDDVPASPRSILSKKSDSSLSAANKAQRFNLKKLRISAPIQKYPGGANSDDDARTPLSPRFYSPAAPPSPPTHASSPQTPYDPEEALDLVQPLPRSTISRNNPPPQIITTAPPRTTPDLNLQIPPPLPINGASPRSATSASSSLPFRAYTNNYEALKSPDLRTTVLDRNLAKHSLQTPRTGVPFTPYSPYMPFTPITPVTPHLVTKKERKDLRKHMGKKLLGGEDMVQSPKDMFGDGW